MINPQLLTKEAGFEDGVVVEIVFSDGRKDISYFNHADDKEAWFTDTFGSWILTDGNNHISIRPLTGPMSIWNHAPEWATFCRTMEEDREGDTIFWYGELHEYDQEVLRKSIDTTERPFWARSGK